MARRAFRLIRERTTTRTGGLDVTSRTTGFSWGRFRHVRTRPERVADPRGGQAVPVPDRTRAALGWIAAGVAAVVVASVLARRRAR